MHSLIARKATRKRGRRRVASTVITPLIFKIAVWENWVRLWPLYVHSTFSWEASSSTANKSAWMDRSVGRVGFPEPHIRLKVSCAVAAKARQTTSAWISQCKLFSRVAETRRDDENFQTNAAASHKLFYVLPPHKVVSRLAGCFSLHASPLIRSADALLPPGVFCFHVHPPLILRFISRWGPFLVFSCGFIMLCIGVSAQKLTDW